MISGANTHDVKLLAATFDGIVVGRPHVEGDKEKNLYLDAGYVGAQTKQDTLDRDYILHI